MAILAVLLSVAAFFLLLPILVSLPLSFFVAFKAKETRVKIIACVAILTNILIIAVYAQVIFGSK